MILITKTLERVSWLVDLGSAKARTACADCGQMESLNEPSEVFPA